MSEKKRIVKQNTRRTPQDKINEAMAKKPTASFINSRGIPAGVPEGKQRLIQRKIRNGQKNKRKATVMPSFIANPAIVLPSHRVMATPEWFNSTHHEPDVSIIVPCYKSNIHIEDQIQWWDLSKDGLTKEIIYVDDACPGKSYSAIIEAWTKRKKELFSPVGKVILNTNNYGFASACNIGAGCAKGKYLIFLNADTKVTPNWIRPMHEVLQDQGVGLVGNLQLRKDETIDSCGSEWDWTLKAFCHRGRFIYNKKRLDVPFTLETAPADLLKVQEVDMVTGACMMISRKLFNEIGGFDRAYQIGYWEDTELNMRVRSHGYKVMFTPHSKIYHTVGHSRAGGHDYMAHNKALFHKRWLNTGIVEGYFSGNRPDKPTVNVPAGSVVAYTAITGNYDELKVHPETSRSDVEFIAYMDREKRPTDPDFWNFQRVYSGFKDQNRNAKIHKIMPHIFFDKEYSLWMDGSVQIHFPFSMQRLIEIYLADCDLAVFKHPERNCIYQEANTCINKKLDNPDIIRSQIQKYTKDGYPSNFGLAELSVLLRRHTPKMKEFNEAWWEEIKNGSKRDQISFNYVANKLKMKFRYFPSDLRQVNHLFKRENHSRNRTIV